MQHEEWRPAPGWEGIYEVSSLGRVRSVARTVRFADGRVRHFASAVRRAHLDGSGYLKLTLKSKDRNERVLVHHLVCTAWHGPRPPGLIVLHGDGKATNCCADNLRWGTYAENTADAIKHGTARRPRVHADEDIEEVRSMRGLLPIRDVAEAYGMSASHVFNVQHGRRRTL